jgi:nicotinamidase-related amidase
MVILMGKMALLVIDLVNDFVKNKKGPLYCPEGEHKIESIAKAVDLFHYYGVQVIYVQDAHRKNDGDFLMRPEHAIAGTWGAELVDQIKARRQTNDYFVPKRRHSAFSYTDLDLFLREEKVEEVILVGGWTNVSIRSTASDAFYQAYRVTVIEDCCFSKSPEMHQSGLQDLAMFAHITILSRFREQFESQMP